MKLAILNKYIGNILTLRLMLQVLMIDIKEVNNEIISETHTQSQIILDKIIALLKEIIALS